MTGDNIQLKQALYHTHEAILADMAGAHEPDTAASLTPAQIKQMADAVAVLPERYSAALYMAYYFDLDDDEAAEALSDDQYRGALAYAKALLKDAVGLERSAAIAADDYRDACTQAMVADMESMTADTAPPDRQPSEVFLQKLKIADRKKTGRVSALTRRVALIALTCVASLTVMIHVNAELRGRILGWFIDPQPEYTAFVLERDEALSEDAYDALYAEMIRFRPLYIPEGFVMENEFISVMSVHLTYVDDSGEVVIHYSATMPDVGTTHMNTEGADVQQIAHAGRELFYWELMDYHYFVWVEEECGFDLITNLPKDEAFRVFEGIEKAPV